MNTNVSFHLCPLVFIRGWSVNTYRSGTRRGVVREPLLRRLLRFLQQDLVARGEALGDLDHLCVGVAGFHRSLFVVTVFLQHENVPLTALTENGVLGCDNRLSFLHVAE